MQLTVTFLGLAVALAGQQWLWLGSGPGWAAVLFGLLRSSAAW